MKHLVARLRTTGGATAVLWIILIAFLACIIVSVLPNMFGKRGGARGLNDTSSDSFGSTPLQPSSQPTSAAQQLLQAPQFTNPHQSPISASVYRSPQASLKPPGSTSSSLAGAATLPPICPSLILPHTEARFMVPIEGLMRASGELDIRGTSGRKLLHGSVTETPEGRRALALASCGCEDDPRITVLAPSRPFAQGPLSSGAPAEGSMGIMEIYGKGGKFYGTLEPAAGGGAMLRYEGEVVMSLEPAAGGGAMLRYE